MEEEDHLYDTIIIGEDITEFMSGEQKTTELKFIDGKLYQKVQVINYGNVISIEDRWDLVEGQ
jgi:adenylate kinase